MHKASVCVRACVWWDAHTGRIERSWYIQYRIFSRAMITYVGREQRERDKKTTQSSNRINVLSANHIEFLFALGYCGPDTWFWIPHLTQQLDELWVPEQVHTCACMDPNWRHMRLDFAWERRFIARPNRPLFDNFLRGWSLFVDRNRYDDLSQSVKLRASKADSHSDNYASANNQ